MEMPPKLAEIVEEFASAPRDVVLDMLLEYSDAVQPLPPEYADHRGTPKTNPYHSHHFRICIRSAWQRIRR